MRNCILAMVINLISYVFKNYHLLCIFSSIIARLKVPFKDKVGELKISELRQKTENALGDQFDIREFHNIILQKGTLTLPL